VNIKTHHKFSQLDCAFMLENILFYACCSGENLFCIHNVLEKALENRKENKKRGNLLGSQAAAEPSPPPRPAHFFPRGPAAAASAASPAAQVRYPSSSH